MPFSFFIEFCELKSLLPLMTFKKKGVIRSVLMFSNAAFLSVIKLSSFSSIIKSLPSSSDINSEYNGRLFFSLLSFSSSL
jgi:hypothetical protein